MAHKKSAMPLMRIARGESVGILLEPLSVISCTTLKSVCVTKRQNRWLPFTVHLSLITVVLVIPIWVSYAFLGYARNNSDALLVRISPRTSCKDTNLICKWCLNSKKNCKKGVDLWKIENRAKYYGHKDTLTLARLTVIRCLVVGA